MFEAYHGCGGAKFRVRFPYITGYAQRFVRPWRGGSLRNFNSLVEVAPYSLADRR